MKLSENQPSTHLVRLELWLDGDSPTGRAVGGGDQTRQFTGWLGLIAAVETLIDDDRERRAGT